MASHSIAITADDYGLDPSINQGIEQLAETGMVDGVSIMAHRDAHLASLDRLAQSGVRLGVHLVLVEERPLSQRPELAPLLVDGRLPRNYRRLFAVLARRPSLLGALAVEAEAQVARLLDSGVKLDFINSHQHVHLLPPIWNALAPLFESAGLEVRAAARPCLGPPKQVLVEVASCLSLLGRPLRRCGRVHPLGIGMAGRLNEPGAAQAARTARLLLRAGARVELVTHPGLASAGLEARYPHWAYHWQSEWSLLASGAVRQVMEEVLGHG